MNSANHPNTIANVDASISINKYLPIAVIYFFLNGFLLPHGLLYTTLFTPIFIIWLSQYRGFGKIFYFFPFFIPFLAVHLANGVNERSYLISSLLIYSVYIFCLTFHRFLKECKSLRSIFKYILIINTVFVLIALAALRIPSITNQFWQIGSISSDIESIKRLKLLTYEASYYSTLLTPLALYYFLKLIILRLPNPWLIIIFLSVPIILSLSFGVILAIFLSLLLTLTAGFKTFFPNKNLPLYIIISTAVLVILIVGFIQLFPENILVQRLNNVLAGRDTSFRGRTTDSFYLGWELAKLKNIWFGVGPGQVKELGLDLFREFYNYPAFLRENVRIPNSLGDTLATFGIIGIIMRLGAQVVLFFTTRVWSNYYRLSLFLFIFFYQFSGSFLTNIAEYSIWILAFHKGLFPEFDKLALRASRIEKNKARLS